MAAALEAFESQCAAGDINALEMRAYALAGLGRYVEAAESLDAFLEARPLHTLDQGTRDRVATQFAVIQTRIATLSLEGNIANANVMVNGRGYGSLPRENIRLAPGEIRVELFAPSVGVIRRVFTMRPGETRREVFDAASASRESSNASTGGTDPNASRTNTSVGGSSANQDARHDHGGGGTSTGHANESVTAGGSSNGDQLADGPTPVRSSARGAPIVSIALGTGAVAAAGGFVGATIWHGNRVAEYDNADCTNAVTNAVEPDIVTACRAVASERDAALATQIATGVVAGGLLIGAGVTLGLWFASAPRVSSARSASAFCAPQLSAYHGLLCGVRF
jgi:hypothetical protein